MSNESKALELADYFERFRTSSHRTADKEPLHLAAAAELRRQHEELQDLRSEITALHATEQNLRAEIESLSRQLAEWKGNFDALQHALVGDTGASGIETANRLRQQLAQRVPDGWTLAPLEPTQEMCRVDFDCEDSIGIDSARICYKTMLSAAPAQPEQPVAKSDLSKEAVELAAILAGMGEGSYELETLYTKDQADGDAFVQRAADLLRLLATNEQPVAQGEPMTLTNDMVLLAARELCKIESGECGVDELDLWNLHSDDFKRDARCALMAAHNIKE